MRINLKYYTYLVLFALLIIVIQSCTLLRMMGDQEFETVSDTLNLNHENNRLTIPVVLNDSETSLFLDTGSDAPFLYDDSILNNKKPEIISKFGKAQNFGNSLDSYFTPLKLETELFNSNNTIFVVLPDFYAINECSKREVTGGFYGKYFLDKIININFEQGKLFILDTLKNTSYTEIESKFFKLTQVQIKLNVNGKSEWFHFDTGNLSSPLLLKEKSKITDDLKHDFVTQSNRLSLVEKGNKTFFYEGLITSFGDENLKSYAVTNDGIKKYKYNNIGLSIIKNYNWIIDHVNQKVYYENYKEGEIDAIQVPKNLLNKVAVEDGKLVIIQILIKTESPIYKLGDQILSVNDEPITSQNVCFYLELLNKTDWNTLNIETKP